MTTRVAYHYTKPTDKSVAHAIVAMQQGLKNHGFGALTHLDMSARLKENGLDLNADFHIFEVCNPSMAKEAMETDLEVGFFLPCKMVVYRKEEQTYVGFLRPKLLMELVGEERLIALAAGLEETLQTVVDEAVQ